jgi:nucleotide-binding universal stress UspA family protein
MQMYGRILIPTDGSDYSKEATDHGLALAKMTGAEVTALFVIDDGSSMTLNLPKVPNLAQTLEDEGSKAVAYIKGEGEKRGVKVKTRIERGSAAPVIINGTRDYDLVVMGTHGRTGVSKLVMGSVAEKVIRLAECPVLVVKRPSVR